MTDAAPLSASSQQAVLDDIENRKKDNRKTAKKHFALTVAGIAGYAVLGALLPTVGVAALATYAAGGLALFGLNRLVRDGGRERVLRQAAADAKQGGFLDGLKAKTARLSKNFFRTRNAFDALFFGSTAAVLVTALSPLTIPAAALITGFAAAEAAYGVYQWVAGATFGAAGVSAAAEKILGADKSGKTAPAPAPAAAQPALAAAPSPAQAFAPAAEKDPKPAPAAPAAPNNLSRPPAPQP